MFGLARFGLYRHLTARRFPVEREAEYAPVAAAGTPVILEIDPRNLAWQPAVVVPPQERRRSGERRSGPVRGGRRRTDAADFNE